MSKRSRTQIIFGQAKAKSSSELTDTGIYVPISFLRPFKPKADTAYFSETMGGKAQRSRCHETLVNDFADFLVSHKLIPGRNAAIDIGIENPPVVVEAKVVDNWAHSIREAIGQLYEYRFFQVASPEAGLIFLASKKVPENWVKYLELDRGIGVAFRTETTGFELSAIAKKTLRIQ
jgi:hypothetical protein